MDKKELKEREAKVIELAVTFCNEKLDEECATLCTQLIQKMALSSSINVKRQGYMTGIPCQ